MGKRIPQESAQYIGRSKLLCALVGLPIVTMRGGNRII